MTSDAHPSDDTTAAWSSPVARRVHTPEDGGSNPPAATTLTERDFELPLFERHKMVAAGFTVGVWRFALGQYRIRLCYGPAIFQGHGEIVREMCTYDQLKAAKIVSLLSRTSDPLAFCRRLEGPWNCEAPGKGRIRLDNTRENGLLPPGRAVTGS